MRRYSNLLLITVLFSMTACTLPKTESSNSEEDSATFFISNDGVSFTSEQLDKQSSVPVAKTYSFQACLSDRKYSRPVQNHTFNVQSTTGKENIAETTSDSNGCIHWNETIQYDHLASAHYVEQKRIISAQGVQKGQRTARFAINPWESTAYSLRDREVPNLVSEEKAAETFSGKIVTDKSGFTHRLNIQDMRVSMYDTETLVDKKIHWNIELRTDPELIVTKSSGEVEHIPLKSGLFDAEVSLIHVVAENGKEKRVRLIPAAAADAKVVDGSLLIEKDVYLPLMCVVGQIQLGLRLTPKRGSSLNLEPFESVFILGQCDSIKSNFFSRQKTIFQTNQGKTKIDEYLTSLEYPTVPTGLNDAQVNVAGTQSSYYIPAQVEVGTLSFSEFEYARSSTTDLIKKFTVSACISAYDRRPMSRQAFEVIGVNGQKITPAPRSDANGCITWNDSVAYNLFDQECERDTPVRIVNKSIGMDQTLPVTINPWSNFAGAYKDLRTVKTTKKCAKTDKSYIIVQGDSYTLTDLSYKINDSLSIQVERKGILNFHPTYYRPTLTNNRYENETGSLPMGSYLLRWAVVTNAPNKSEDRDLLAQDRNVLYVGEKIVDVLASDEIAFNDFKIATDHLKDLGNTVQFVIEMSLLKPNFKDLLKANPKAEMSELEDKRPNFEYYTMAAPTILKDTWSFGHFSNMSQGESVILKLKEKLAKHQQQEEQRIQSLLNKKDLLAKKENLLLINLNQKSPMLDYVLKTLNASGSQVSAKDLQSLIADRGMNTKMANKMCELWFDHLLQTPLYYLAPNSFSKNSTKGQSRLFTRLVGTEADSSIYRRLCKNQPASSYFDITSLHFINKIDQSNKEYILPMATDKNGVQHRSVSTGIDFSFSESISENLFGGAGGKVGAGVGKGPVEAGAEVEGGYALAISRANNKGTSVSIGTSLDVDMVPFELSSSDYEKCKVIKLNPRLFAGVYSLLSPYGNGSLPKRVNPLISFSSTEDTTFEQSREIFSKGLMLCEGAPRKQNTSMKFVETYYFINQPFESSTGAVMSSLDNNRRLFATLRGNNAWMNFMGLIRGQIPNVGENGPMGILDAGDTTSDKEQKYIRFGLENAFRGVQKWPGVYISE